MDTPKPNNESLTGTDPMALAEISNEDLRTMVCTACRIRDHLAQKDAERAAFWNEVAASLDEEFERRVAAERELMTLVCGEDRPDDEWTPE